MVSRAPRQGSPARLRGGAPCERAAPLKARLPSAHPAAHRAGEGGNCRPAGKGGVFGGGLPRRAGEECGGRRPQKKARGIPPLLLRALLCADGRRGRQRGVQQLLYRQTRGRQSGDRRLARAARRPVLSEEPRYLHHQRVRLPHRAAAGVERQKREAARLPQRISLGEGRALARGDRGAGRGDPVRSVPARHHPQPQGRRQGARHHPHHPGKAVRHHHPARAGELCAAGVRGQRQDDDHAAPSELSHVQQREPAPRGRARHHAVGQLQRLYRRALADARAGARAHHHAGGVLLPRPEGGGDRPEGAHPARAGGRGVSFLSLFPRLPRRPEGAHQQAV